MKVCVECEVFHYDNNYKLKLNNEAKLDKVCC